MHKYINKYQTHIIQALLKMYKNLEKEIRASGIKSVVRKKRYKNKI